MGNLSVPSESYYSEHDMPEIHPTSMILKNGPPSISHRNNQSAFTDENPFDANLTASEIGL